MQAVAELLSDQLQEQAQAELVRQTRRGQESKNLLSNPALVEAFKDMEAQCRSEMTRQIEDDKAVLAYGRLLACFWRVEDILKFHVENGQISEKQLREMLDLDKKGLLGGLLGR